MAESNQRKVVNPISHDDDDPFAELTRIMGFDPRMSALAQVSRSIAADAASAQASDAGPVRSAADSAARPAPAPAADPYAADHHDDFSLDLEKELLGEFAQFDTQDAAPPAPTAAAPLRNPPAPAPRQAAAAPVTPAAGLADGEFDDVFSQALEEPSAVPAPAAPASAKPVAAVEPSASTADDEFDDVFARSVREAPQARPEQSPAPTAHLATAHLPTAAADAPAADTEFDRIFAQALRDQAGLPPVSAEAEVTVSPVNPVSALPENPIGNGVVGYDTEAAPEPLEEADPWLRPAGEGRFAEAAVPSRAQPAAEEELLPHFDLDDLDLPVAEIGVSSPASGSPGDVWSQHHAEAPLELDRGGEAAYGRDGDAELLEDRHEEPRYDEEPAYDEDRYAALDRGGDETVDDRWEEPAVPATADAYRPVDGRQPDLDLDELDLEPVAAVAEAIESRPVASSDPMAEVDMDFRAAFEAAADARPLLDPIGDDVPAVPVRTASDDHFEISLEDELNDLLDEEPSHAPPPPVAPPRQAPRSSLLSGARWAMFDRTRQARPDADGGSAEASYAEAYGTPAGNRPSFANPSLIARHANYQASSAMAAPQAAGEQSAARDLDDLIDAMEARDYAPERTPAADVAAPLPVYDYRPEPPVDTAYAYDEELAGPVEEEELPAETGYDAVPDIETVDVPETAVAVADELDIPELAYDDRRPHAPAYDDIDADFTAAFNDTSPSEEPVNNVVRGAAQPADRYDLDAEFEAAHAQIFADAGGQPGGSYQQAAAGYPYQQQDYDDFDQPDRSAAEPRDRFVDYDFGSDGEDDAAEPYAAREQARPRRRGLLVAAAAVGVAVVGGVAALAFSFGGGEISGTPVVVKADDSPVKVRPENPGGTVVPNQENKVYDAVKGASKAESPTQQKLVTTAEEPIDMAAVEQSEAAPAMTGTEPLQGADTADTLPGVPAGQDMVAKAEDRIDPAAAGIDNDTTTEGVVVAPRKVKTMVVRSDGTLVPRDSVGTGEPVAETGTAATVVSLPVGQPAPADVAATGTAADDVADDDAADIETVAPQPVQSRKVTAEGEVQPAPEPAPAAAAAKPAEAPAEQVASANVESASVATGVWSVQISSQPSAEGAKQSYQDLAKRYASVIGGRGVNIVKADIAGKGTYWRVRVPATSRDDAINICNQYKAAGGTCFVSK